MSYLDLNQREQEILKEIVTCYLICNEPISSRYLSKIGKFPFSPATIRNIMLDLEEKGYLIQPHVSAGRIPSDKGFRFYIQEIIKEKLKSPKFLNQIANAFEQYDFSKIIEVIPKLMATITHQIGLLIAPHFGHIPLKSIDFIPVDEKRILAVLVARSGTILNKIISVDCEWTRTELSVISRYLTSQFFGKSLFQIKEKLQNEEKVMGMEGNYLPKSLKLSQSVIDELNNIEIFHIEGDIAKESALNLLLKLRNSEKEKEKLYEILNKCIEYDSPQIFIGQESNFTAKYDCALVISKYGIEEQPYGAVGIIGSKTMPYQLVIPLVQETAKLLSKRISNREV